MKTIKEWIESISDPEVRRKALNNTRQPELSIQKYSLHEAFALAFIWNESPEGEEYWSAVYQSFLADEYARLAAKLEEPIKTKEQRDKYLQALKDLDEAFDDSKIVLSQGCPYHLGIKLLIQKSEND